MNICPGIQQQLHTLHLPGFCRKMQKPPTLGSLQLHPGLQQQPKQLRIALIYRLSGSILILSRNNPALRQTLYRCLLLTRLRTRRKPRKKHHNKNNMKYNGTTHSDNKKQRPPAL